MAKPKKHKKQHFVPRSYLRAWCDPTCPVGQEPYVWVFDKDGSNGRRKAPGNLFTETDLYTITMPDGSRDLRLEHGLSQLEDTFARIRLTHLGRNRALTQVLQVWLAAFVAASQFRTVASRDHHAAQWGDLLDKCERFAEHMEDATPAQREAMARMPITSGPSLNMEEVKRLAEAPLQTMMGSMLRIQIPVFAKMNLTVFCTDDPVGFITTDAPCTWFDPDAYRRPPFWRSPGLGVRTIEVTLPVSPSQCLYYSWHPEFSGYMPTPQQLLHELNRRHRAHCNESYVVCRNDRRDYWFSQPPLPDDAWERVHAPEGETVTRT